MASIDEEKEKGIIAEVLKYCTEAVQPSKKDEGNIIMCHSLDYIATYIVTYINS